MVPDELVTKLILAEIPEEGSFLLDGFPRTPGQAAVLDEHVDVETVIDLDVPFDVIMVSFYEFLEKRFSETIGVDFF